MDKSKVTRRDLKHNFLKQIIIRADFRGVDEDEISQSLSTIKEYLKENQYIRYRTETASEIDYRLNDPQSGEIPIPVPSNIRRTEVHVFQNKEQGIYVRLSTSFVLISIESAKYKDCLTYCQNIYDLLNRIQSNASFFELCRFGIRKINNCIIMDEKLINKYFESNVIKLYKEPDTQIRSKVSVSRDFFTINNYYNVNFLRTIVCGETSDKKNAYQITIDSDIYVTEEYCSYVMSNFKDKSNEMNEYLFCIYKNSVKEELIGMLSQEKFDSNMIIGVENNG